MRSKKEPRLQAKQAKRRGEIEEQEKADGGGKPAHGKCAIRGVADSKNAR